MIISLQPITTDGELQTEQCLHNENGEKIYTQRWKQTSKIHRNELSGLEILSLRTLA